MDTRAIDRLRDRRGITLTEMAVTLALLGMLMAGTMMVWSKTQQAYFVGSEAAENQQNVRAAIDFMVRELRATGRDVTVCAFDYAGPTSLDCTAAKAATCVARVGGSYNSCGSVFAMPFANVTASTILIRSDRNDNGTIAGTVNASAGDPGEESVRYALATGAPPCPAGVAACIIRDDGGGPAALVAVDVAGFTLTYYPRPGYPPCSGVPPPSPCPPFASPPATQQDADNVARIRIDIASRSTIAGQPVNRRLQSDVALRNRS
jgi:prepilin-type N-terminal cleavage/methylation domain-containing protein